MKDKRKNALAGDEEEYSYSGYTQDTAEQIAEKGGHTYSGEEEEYSYSGYAADVKVETAPYKEAEEELAISGTASYGDFLVEEFSVEAGVKKVSGITKLNETAVKYVVSCICILVGVLCSTIPETIELALSYIVGGLMAVMAVARFVFAMIKKEYRHTDSNLTASSLILMGLSVMIIIEHEWAHTFIPIVWGVFGLFEGAHAFNHAFSRISRGMRCSYYIVKGIIEVAVAFLLLYKPEEYGELHIIVFGISLIFDGVTNLPVIKKKLAKG